jgi:hypothetical protein
VGTRPCRVGWRGNELGAHILQFREGEWMRAAAARGAEAARPPVHLIPNQHARSSSGNPPQRVPAGEEEAGAQSVPLASSVAATRASSVAQRPPCDFAQGPERKSRGERNLRDRVAPTRFLDALERHERLYSATANKGTREGNPFLRRGDSKRLRAFGMVRSKVATVEYKAPIAVLTDGGKKEKRWNRSREENSSKRASG